MGASEIKGVSFNERNRNTAFGASATSGIRRVQTETQTPSTMPGAPSNQAFKSSIRDTATDFNASYAKQGLQPSSIDDPKNNPYQPIKQVSRSDEATRREEIHYYNSKLRSVLPKRTKLAKGGIAAKLAGRSLSKVRVTSVNTGIWSWGIFSWLIFQLPFALLSIVFLGLAGLVDSLTSSTQTNKSGDFVGFIAKGVAYGFSTLKKAVAATVNLITGFDINLLNPENFFMLTYMVVFFFGMFTLLLIYIIYKLAFLHPLSGRGAGMKKGFLLLAIIGYSVPILNLIPWFIFWTMAVWWRPR